MNTSARHLANPTARLLLLVPIALAAGGCSMLPLGHGAPRAATPPPAKTEAKPVAHAKPARAAKKSGKSPAPAPVAERAPRNSAAEMAQQLALAPQEPFWPYRIAQRLADADSAAFAEEWYQLALARDAHFAPALAALSALWFTQGRHDEAIRLLEGARRDAAAWPDGFPPALSASLALHYDAVDRVSDARTVMDGVPRSGHEATLGAQVYLTLRGEHPEDAGALAKESAHDHPKNAASQNNYGITRLRQGELDDARKAFAKAIDLDPSLPGPYYNLAILEKFYAFDDEAASKWFRLYRERADADPDGLAQVFTAPVTGELARKGDR